MKSFKSWLKFYFLGFVSDRYSAEGAGRSLWNSALSILLMIVILCTGFFTGFVTSFKTHYSSASVYREFIDGALEGKSLTVKDGKLLSEEYVNDYAALKEGEKLEGYGLILDTRPAATTFADFKIICRDNKDNEISYDEYYKLSEENKKSYSLGLENSGKWLDPALKQAEYKEFLNSSETGKKTLGELDAKKDRGELDEKGYADEVYIAFVKGYYPSFSRVEQYGRAPTLRTYYMGMITAGFSDKFLMLLDDICVGSFETDKNVSVDFEGYYGGIKDGAVQDIDGFINQAFGGSGGFSFLVYFINMFKLTPVILIVLLVLALLTFIVCRYKTPQIKTGYIGSFKIVCSYLLGASLLSFIIAVVLSFTSAKMTAYMITAVVFNVIVAARTAAFLIHQYILARKAAAEDNEQENI